MSEELKEKLKGLTDFDWPNFVKSIAIAATIGGISGYVAAYSLANE